MPKTKLGAFIERITGTAKAEYKARRDGLAGRVEVALQVSAYTAVINAARKKAEAAAEKHHYSDARAALDELERLVGLAEEAPPDPARSIAVGDRLESTWLPTRGLPVVAAGLTAQRQKVVTAMKAGEYDAADAAIKVLDGMVSNALAEFTAYTDAVHAAEGRIDDLAALAAPEADGLRSDLAAADTPAAAGDYGTAATRIIALTDRAKDLLPLARARVEWGEKLGTRNEIAGKLSALAGWGVGEAAPLQSRFDALTEQATEGRKEYGPAVAGLDGLLGDVSKLHSAESGKRKEAKQQEKVETDKALDEEGHGVQELFGQAEAENKYPELDKAQKARHDEAVRRCQPVPALQGDLAPVTRDYQLATQAAAAKDFIKANELLRALDGPIDAALKAADTFEAAEAELRKQIDALKARTDEAAKPGPTDEVTAARKAATDKLGEVNAHLGKRELKEAQEDFALLGPALDAAEQKLREFEAAKLDAENKRKALPNYAAALAIADAPPPGGELADQVRDFRAKEKVVTDAEAAGKWTVAQNARTLLQASAKKLVDTHALWDAYAKAYTPAIKKDVEAAVVIVGANPADLKAQVDPFVAEHTPWDIAVNNGDWKAAKDAVPELARTAKALVDTHALWEAYTTAATAAFHQDREAAIKVYNKFSPDLTAEGAEFLSKFTPWRDALKKPVNWQAAKDAVAPLHKAATDLTAAEQALRNNFNAAYTGQAKTDIQAAIKVRKLNLAGLTPATRAWAAVFDPWEADYGASKWTAATAAVPAVHEAAKKYLTAKATYDAAEAEFNKGKKAVANLTAAINICFGKPQVSVDNCPAEVRNFWNAYLTMLTAVDRGDWVAAKAALTPLPGVIAPLIPAFNDWKPYGQKAQALAPLIEKARLAAATAPARLQAEKVAFETEANKIGPAATAKTWTAALAAVNATEPVATALLDARARYDKERQPFDAAAAAARAAYAKAAAVIRAIPPGKATDPKVVAVTTAEADMAAAERDERWDDGVKAAKALETKSGELVAAAASFDTGVSEEDAKVVPDKLKALEPRTNKAKDAPPLSAHVDKLQKAVVAQLGVVNAKVTAKAYVEAGVQYEALVAAVEKMEEAKAAYTTFKEKFDAAETGPVKEARDLGADPKAVADVRDAALNKRKKRIEAVAKAGQISLATGLVATWVEEAKGWKAKWAEAKEAHTALTTPPPDEAKLAALANADGGGKVFDDLVAALPDDTNAAVFATAMQVRYGVDITQYKKQQDNFYDLEAVPKNAPDKSVKKLYKLLATVPDSHVKGPLKEIVRYTKDSDGGDYSGLMKKMNLYCGRSDDGGLEPLVKPSELPEVDEDCKPVDNQNPKQFGYTALHEVGHAIDDAAGFMAQRRGDAKFGGWLTSSPDDAAAAAAEHFGFPKDYILKVLNNKGAPIPADRPAAPTGTDPADWTKAQTRAENWCAKVVEDYGLWWKGAECDAVAIGGRVYQQAYSSEWFSYPAAARKQGITGYQFRSPAEWFAELYAAYYTRKLKDAHPAVSWLKDLKQPTA